MNVRHPMGVLRLFSVIKNIFYDKMNLRVFLFSCDDTHVAVDNNIFVKICKSAGVLVS